MLVFISWSGDKSKKVALELKKFIKITLQGVIPWISEDIEKGTRWSEAISDKLEESKFGIACLTQDNLNSEWLNFESGAIAKNKKANLWTYLIDVEYTNITGPLSQFQHTISSSREDVLILIKTIRNKLKETGSDGAPEDEQLEQYFDKFWDDFIKEIEKIKKETPHKKEKPRPTEEIIEEILLTVRRLENKVTKYPASISLSDPINISGASTFSSSPATITSGSLAGLRGGFINPTGVYITTPSGPDSDFIIQKIRDFGEGEIGQQKKPKEKKDDKKK